MEAVFCCVQCRLLQAPTTSCADCGTPMVAPVELVRELLQYRDMNMGRGRDWAFITAMIAGGSIAFPVLAPVALGSMIALAVTKLRALRKRRAIAGVELPLPHAIPGARTIIGIPRRFRSTVASLVDDVPLLMQHAVVKDKEGGVLLRRSAGTAFLLERADDVPVLVTGVTRVVTPSMFGVSPLRAPVKRGDARLARMGVPSDLAIAGELQVASLAEGDLAIAVTGALVDDEAVAELAFHREGGRVPVMRGVAGAPLLVEDRRLLAASIPGGERFSGR